MARSPRCASPAPWGEWVLQKFKLWNSQACRYPPVFFISHEPIREMKEKSALALCLLALAAAGARPTRRAAQVPRRPRAAVAPSPPHCRGPRATAPSPSCFPLLNLRARHPRHPPAACDPQALTRGRGRGASCFSPALPVAGPPGARGLGSCALQRSSGAWSGAWAARAPGRRAFALASLRGGATADGMEAQIGPLKAKRLCPSARYRPLACCAPRACLRRGCTGSRGRSARLTSGGAQASREELGGRRGI